MERSEQAWAERACLWTRPYVMGALFVPASLVGGLFPSFSLAASLYVILLGGALLAAGMWNRMPRVTTPRALPAGVAWWLIPVALFAVVEVATFAGGSTDDSPTMSLLADPLLEGYTPRCAAYFCWLMVFWGMVRR